jgi:pSer/pThr/pTyr-binding forkhead associated (FHA) protein
MSFLRLLTHVQSRATAEYWLTDQEGIYPLKTGVNTIGRSADSDVVIQWPYVSRRHCTIVVHVGCELHDFASKNGTYVNGLKVNGSTHLVSGDEIWICRRRLVFLSNDRNTD